ncbi:hypothetical protein Aperf_G00000084421 [Anoplocephala perfoliata]
MSKKEDKKPENLIVESIKEENVPSAFTLLPKLPHLSDGGERSLTALDLRTGTSRKRSFPGDVAEADGAPKNKIPKRKPTDQELALNYFIKQLAHEMLDRRLTIMQQPRNRLAQLEAACRRQFPAFNERQIRLKIRGQLKLYRRNLKKAEERKLIKPSQVVQQPGQLSSLSLIQLTSNSNAISMAHRALANERKRVKASVETTQDAMPLKDLNEWQIENAIHTPIMISKPLTINRSNPCIDGAADLTTSVISGTPFEPKVVHSNPPSSLAISSPLNNIHSPAQVLQANNSAVDFNALKTLLESSKIPNTSEPSSDLTDSAVPNLSALDPAPDQTSESLHLNQTWPSAVSNPSLDASACVIASCLRLAANYLLQSATLFETNSPTIAELNSPILPLLTGTILGSTLTSIPPSLGTPAKAFSLVSSASTVPTQTSSTTGVLTATPADPSVTNSSC